MRSRGKSGPAGGARRAARRRARHDGSTGQRLGRKIRRWGGSASRSPSSRRAHKLSPAIQAHIFTSASDLAEQMLAYVETYNQTARPFKWTYAGKVLEA
jgi:hypothetical protein